MSDEAVTSVIDESQDVNHGNVNDLQKFLTFEIDDGLYGVDILAVREIKGWEELTKLPNSPEYMKGVMNLRGVVIPIFDLKKRFKKGESTITQKNVIIIIAVDSEKMIGILVDAVSDIVESDFKNIKDSPQTDVSIDDKFIKGLIPGEKGMTILLDTKTLFSQDDLASACEGANS